MFGKLYNPTFLLIVLLIVFLEYSCKNGKSSEEKTFNLDTTQTVTKVISQITDAPATKFPPKDSLSSRLIDSASIAQSYLDERILNMKWGESTKNVKNIMLKRKGVTLNLEKPNKIYFNGGQMGGNEVDFWVFVFNKDKFHKISIHFQTGEYTESVTFELLKSLLVQKYGKPVELNIGLASSCEWTYQVKNKKPIYIGLIQLYGKGVLLSYNNSDLQTETTSIHDALKDF